MTSTDLNMESGSHAKCVEDGYLNNENGSHKNVSSNNRKRDSLGLGHASEEMNQTENTTNENSSDDDDTLSNNTENDEDEKNTEEEEDVVIEPAMESQDSVFSEFQNRASFKGPNTIHQVVDSSSGNDGNPVFYLGPSAWEKENLRKTINCYRSTSSPTPSNMQIENNSSSHSHVSTSKPNSCPRIPSPLSLNIPLNNLPGIRKPSIPQSRRLLSPQTVYNPLLNRIHQSESMQTLPECCSCDCISTKIGDRVRSFSSSSNQRSCNNIYRQSFGSGSFSGQVHPPLSRSESAYFASPVKRGSVVNATGHNIKRLPAAFNHMRHRKTAIPLLCSRSAAMVRKINKLMFRDHVHGTYTQIPSLINIPTCIPIYISCVMRKKLYIKMNLGSKFILTFVNAGKLYIHNNCSIPHLRK